MSISQTRSPRYYAIGLLGVGIALLFLFSQLGPVQSATQKSKRTFESAIPSQVPLKVKIKKEKEDKALDTENKDWFRDIEIEITNTSDKPIYFLSLDVVMKDVLTDAGVMMSFPIRYGRTDFYDHNTKPTREDIPIEPKATMTFSFEEDNKIGWEAWRRKHKRNDPLKLEVWFHHLNFGDGTGFTSLNALPFPFKARRSWTMFRETSSAGPMGQDAHNVFGFICRELQSTGRPPAGEFISDKFFCARRGWRLHGGAGYLLSGNILQQI